MPFPLLFFVPLTLLLLSPLTNAARIDSKRALNITLYHVNERNYSVSPRNMNTADINGDIYFDLRTKGLPLECGALINTSFWSQLDCDNPEVANASQLAITKLILEVDTNWGDYADCNVDPGTGVYTCACENVPNDDCGALTSAGAKTCGDTNGCDWDHGDGRCESYGCSNITQKLECIQGYRKCAWDAAQDACADPPGPKPVCNKSLVGFLNLSNVDWGRSSHYSMSKVDYWHGNTLAKTFGFWYSTWTEGECRPDDPKQHFCSWRLVAAEKISKMCSDASIDAAVIAGDAHAPWGARCFSGCSVADRHNSSSACFIECFYNNVLGPHGSSQLMNHTSPNFGMPLSELRVAWARPFLSVAEGGCPPLLLGKHP